MLCFVTKQTKNKNKKKLAKADTEVTAVAGSQNASKSKPIGQRGQISYTLHKCVMKDGQTCYNLSVSGI